MTPLNPLQEKARERFPHGALRTIEGWVNDHWIFTNPDLLTAAEEGGTFLFLPTVLDRLSYEPERCEKCEGSGHTPTTGTRALVTSSTEDVPCRVCDGTGQRIPQAVLDFHDELFGVAA